MFRAILAKIPALAPLVTLTLAAILLTLAAPAYADGHHDKQGPFWFDKNGRTRLFPLALLKEGDDPVADLARAQDLLSRGANPNVLDIYFNTPLLYAVGTDFIKMASLLIANGAYVNVRNHDSKTAMDYAISKGNTRMQALLRAHGGECNKECQ